MTETTYTAVVTATGEGCNGGRATAADGSLDVTLAIPKELGGIGGATSPEQLLCAGWASCFLGVVKIVAAQEKVAQEKVELADLAVAADITLHNESADYRLSAALHPEVSAVDQAARRGAGPRRAPDLPLLEGDPGNVEVTVDPLSRPSPEDAPGRRGAHRDLPTGVREGRGGGRRLAPRLLRGRFGRPGRGLRVGPGPPRAHRPARPRLPRGRPGRPRRGAARPRPAVQPARLRRDRARAGAPRFPRAGAVPARSRRHPFP